jgi:hypothetical protein
VKLAWAGTDTEEIEARSQGGRPCAVEGPCHASCVPPLLAQRLEANLTLSIEANLTLTPLYHQGLPGVLAAVRE